MISWILTHPYLCAAVWLVSMGLAWAFVFGASKASGRDDQ